VESWYFDLTEANKNPEEAPSWQRLYSTSKDFGFRPKNFWDWDYAVRQLRENDELFNKYHE
jgi:hypothetical protein